ncbi:MAG TPA: hypothetical protein VJ692_11170 [Nitrospiraceae bacterium]|nr:hypothetical protein [Nitrospiraceae bacterium]
MEVQRTLQQWSVGGTRVKWAAVFAGLVVGIAVQMMLTLLGFAIGAWSIDLREAQPAGGIPLSTGIWTGISMLISAFVGGYVTARLSGTTLRSDGLFHGAVVWGMNWLVFGWLATTAMSFMIGGLFNAFGSGIQMLGQGVGTAVSAAASKSTNAGPNISAGDLRQQIESVLKATGKPELQPSEIKKDAGKVTDTAQSGQPLNAVTDSAVAEIREKLAALDREAAVNIMVNKFGMSKTQAQDTVQSLISAIAPIKDAANTAKERSVDIGNTAIDRLGSAAWWLFLLSLLSLGASLGGGLIGIAIRTSLVEGESYATDVRRTA